MTRSTLGWALITGASSGLGIEFARALASRGYDLVLTARRELPMQELAAELRKAYGNEVVVEPIDLASTEGATALQRRLDDHGIVPAVLVNNAGFGLFGHFVDQEPDRTREMLQLDILALTELTLGVGRRMAERGNGHILLVASVAAFQPTPLYAAYGAAKAYVLSLGEALHVEFAPKVGVTVVSPGLMDTGFLGVSGQQASTAMKRNMSKPVDVVKIGLDALFAGKSSVTPGRLNKVAAFANRFTSRRLQAKLILRIQQG